MMGPARGGGEHGVGMHVGEGVEPSHVPAGAGGSRTELAHGQSAVWAGQVQQPPTRVEYVAAGSGARGEATAGDQPGIRDAPPGRPGGAGDECFQRRLAAGKAGRRELSIPEERKKQMSIRVDRKKAGGEGEGDHLGRAERRVSLPGGEDVSAPARGGRRLASGLSRHKLDLDPEVKEKVDEVLRVPRGCRWWWTRRALPVPGRGRTSDYHDELHRSGFSISNPSAKSTLRLRVGRSPCEARSWTARKKRPAGVLHRQDA